MKGLRLFRVLYCVRYGAVPYDQSKTLLMPSSHAWGAILYKLGPCGSSMYRVCGGNAKTHVLLRKDTRYCTVCVFSMAPELASTEYVRRRDFTSYSAWSYGSHPLSHENTAVGTGL